MRRRDPCPNRGRPATSRRPAREVPSTRRAPRAGRRAVPSGARPPASGVPVRVSRATASSKSVGARRSPACDASGTTEFPRRPWIHDAPSSIGTPHERSVRMRPPTRSLASSTTTSAPRAASSAAAVAPASPAPITMTRPGSAADAMRRAAVRPESCAPVVVDGRPELAYSPASTIRPPMTASARVRRTRGGTPGGRAEYAPRAQGSVSQRVTRAPVGRGALRGAPAPVTAPAGRAGTAAAAAPSRAARRRVRRSTSLSKHGESGL